ncbi:hypothetical protein HY620_03065 [Candidatus Uhrbacteria bacterium]|nr:hypothetical protein [Candidatus Uhrbacteria bacterium]
MRYTRKIYTGIAASIVASFFVAIAMSSNVVVASSEGPMIGCPHAMDMVGMCPMTFDQHLAHWLSLFSAITPDSQTPLLALVSFVVWTGFFLLSNTYFRNIYRIASSRGDPRAQTFIAFLRAFRRGRIHPKLYA